MSLSFGTDVSQAGAELSIRAWNSVAPAFLREAQRKYADAINSPRIGCEENDAFPAWQLNIANEQASPGSSISVHFDGLFYSTLDGQTTLWKER